MKYMPTSRMISRGGGLPYMMNRRLQFLLYLTASKLLFFAILDIPAVKANCEAPPEIDGASHNLTSSPPHLVNTQIQYQCSVGYTGSGISRMYRCNGTHWVGEGYRCEEILCSFIDPPENGVITNNPTYTVGSTIEFGCLAGFDINGPSTRRCRIDGWTSSMPVCRPKMCGEFDGVENAYSFQETLDGVPNDYGSEITITCHQNYILSGPWRVVCGADGQWSEAPTCEPSVCPTYPVSTSNCTTHSKAINNLYLVYCVAETENTSATRVGGSFAICLDNQWSDTTLACYCNCKVRVDTEKVILHNVDNRNFLRHGEVLRWSCINGRKLSETDLACYDGNIGEPVCLVPTTTTTPIPTTPKYTTDSSSTSSTITLSRKASMMTSTSTTPISMRTSAQPLPTKTLSFWETTTPLNQAVVMINVCRCNCSVHVDQEFLDLVMTESTVESVVSNCSIITPADPKNGLSCDFGHLGTTICQPSDSKSVSSESTSVWNSVARALTERTREQIREVCRCTKATDSPLSKAAAISNVYTKLVLFMLVIIM